MAAPPAEPRAPSGWSEPAATRFEPSRRPQHARRTRRGRRGRHHSRVARGEERVTVLRVRAARHDPLALRQIGTALRGAEELTELRLQAPTASPLPAASVPCSRDRRRSSIAGSGPAKARAVMGHRARPSPRAAGDSRAGRGPCALATERGQDPMDGRRTEVMSLTGVPGKLAAVHVRLRESAQRAVHVSCPARAACARPDRAVIEHNDRMASEQLSRTEPLGRRTAKPSRRLRLRASWEADTSLSAGRRRRALAAIEPA